MPICIIGEESRIEDLQCVVTEGDITVAIDVLSSFLVQDFVEEHVATDNIARAVNQVIQHIHVGGVPYPMETRLSVLRSLWE